MNQYTATVIGLGQIGLMYDFDPKRERPSSHTLAYKLNSKIQYLAASDTRPEQAEFLGKIAPEVKFYQNAREMLTKHPVDIVSVCTPPGNHLEAVKTALHLAAPRIIFCEKPLASNIAETVELMEQLKRHSCLLVPNLSRRWNSGMRRIKNHILNGKYGQLQKIHVRYTRGIFNTGAHLFDLLHWWSGQINKVQVIEKIKTSADKDNDPSFTFNFQIGRDILGIAEAFDDEQYYLFEIDLCFSQGKIEIRNSGDDVFYYQVGEHHLFTGFKSLKLQKHESILLAEANLKNAVEHLVQVLDGVEKPVCTIDDGIYPLYVARALLASYGNSCAWEKVALPKEMQQ
jgi:predicted dehydrogenase